MQDMNPKGTGGKDARGRFKTTRQYTFEGVTYKKEFVAKLNEKGKVERDSEVRARADKWVYDHKGTKPTPSITVDSAWTLYADYRAKRKTEKGVQDIRFAQKVAKPHIGALKVTELSADTVNKTLELIEASCKTPRTAQKVRQYGKAAYNWFMKKGWATRNPFSDADPVSYRADEWGEPITQEHFQKALDAETNPVYRAAYLFLRWTSARPAAATGLLWADLTEDDKGRMFYRRRVKTDASDRPQFVPQTAADAINALPRVGLYVFTLDGSKLGQSTISRAWNRAQERAGLSVRNLYDLRDLRLTELADSLSEKELQSVAGHASAATTKRHYVKVAQQKLIEKLGG